jgi:hemerythrin
VFQYKWDSSFSVGYPLIDEQHQELFVKVNALLAAIQLGQGKDQLKKAVDFLSDYTVKHFFDEEQLQKKYRYPDHPNHHKYHEFFKGTVRDFSKELIMRGANEKLADEMRKKLGSWLIDHIKVQDVKLGAYLRSKAAQGE